MCFQDFLSLTKKQQRVGENQCGLVFSPVLGQRRKSYLTYEIAILG